MMAFNGQSYPMACFENKCECSSHIEASSVDDPGLVHYYKVRSCEDLGIVLGSCQHHAGHTPRDCIIIITMTTSLFQSSCINMCHPDPL